MTESTTLIKKAVLTSVGATSNFDRVKTAIEDAMQDLVKVGNDLIDELEEQGKVKADKAQNFLKNVKDEAKTKSEEIEDKVSVKVRSAAKDLGFVSRREYEDILSRLEVIEARLEIEPLVDIADAKEAPKQETKKRGRSKKSQTNKEETAKDEAAK